MAAKTEAGVEELRRRARTIIQRKLEEVRENITRAGLFEVIFSLSDGT